MDWENKSMQSQMLTAQISALKIVSAVCNVYIRTVSSPFEVDVLYLGLYLNF